MTISSSLLNFVKQTAFFANTPAYIYNTLRDQENISLFSKSYSTTAIIDELKNINKNTPKSSDEIAFIYLLLIALSYKDDFDLSQLNEIDLSDVPWYAYILSYLSIKTFTTKVDIVQPQLHAMKASIIKETESTIVYNNVNLNNKSQNAI